MSKKLFTVGTKNVFIELWYSIQLFSIHEGLQC